MEQVQLENWKKYINKVIEFNFLNEELMNLQEGGGKTCLMLESLVTWSKKSLNIVYEA